MHPKAIFCREVTSAIVIPAKAGIQLNTGQVCETAGFPPSREWRFRRESHPLDPKLYLGSGLSAKLCFTSRNDRESRIDDTENTEAQLLVQLRSEVQLQNEEK